VDFNQYAPHSFYDELFHGDGTPRPFAEPLVQQVNALSRGELHRRQKAAEIALLNMGVTFNTGGAGGTERIFPFDIVPRLIVASEWDLLERGLKQRIRALNAFLQDIYNDQHALTDGVLPRHVVESSQGFLPACKGLTPPGGVWIHVTGTDLIRDREGTFHVLEDNLRCPSGVSYVLGNRSVMKQIFPELFEKNRVRPVDDYPQRLLDVLRGLSSALSPVVVLLTPGVHNSAYFEHSFLAQQMGVDLVEGGDLFVKDGWVHMRTTQGLQRVNVIYRRIDDVFMDPDAFKSDSLLGVPGLMEVYRSGRVALANAPGTGIADDKVVYSYVPEMIRYYLAEEPLIPNVPTYLCWEDAAREMVLNNLETLVVKAANESGGYGMLIGPASSPSERADFAKKIQENPRNYIAQPTVGLSQVPTLVNAHFEGRHVDLRPYILFGRDVHVLPGGLTRVALRKGSLVVNSSQGGGSKDTWVIESVPQRAC
jgi:uncharacterized circularly permuted ATP-grasp superfamily protein